MAERKYRLRMFGMVTVAQTYRPDLQKSNPNPFGHHSQKDQLGNK